MYGIIVTMTVRDDQREAFEGLVKALAAAVKTHEPGNLDYRILRNRAAPESYRIVEIYSSKEAFKQHLAADYVRNTNPLVQKTLSAAPQVEAIEVVA
jgi:quinol monooxygenase YgiN